MFLTFLLILAAVSIAALGLLLARPGAVLRHRPSPKGTAVVLAASAMILLGGLLWAA